MKSTNILLAIITVGIILVFPNTVFAHPGRTDANGGHTCRTNCAEWGLEDGEYHLHNSDGGYTDSSGQEYDKDGNLITTSSPEPTPSESEPIPEPEPIVVSEPEPTSEPTPAPEPEPEVTTKESMTAEPITTEPEPTAEIQEDDSALVEDQPTNVNLDVNENTNQATNNNTGTVKETNAANTATSDDDEGGGAVGTLVTLGILGGGYYLYKKFGKKKA